MPTCWHCKAESSASHYDRIVHNKTALYGEWAGWRLSGRFLISPAGARFTPERLAAIALHDRATKRLAVVGNVIPFTKTCSGSRTAF